MKTRISLITILVIALFLISTTVVATSFAKPQQTEPLPQSQQQPPSTQIEVKAKEEFWDLEVDHFVIKGKSFPFPNDFNKAEKIYVKVGETVTFRSYYTIKTIPIGDITGADAKHWGSGNFMYKISGGMFFAGPPSAQEYKTLTRHVPTFTAEDVQQWKQSMQSTARKTWTSYLVYTWTPQMKHIGKDDIYFHFSVDSFLAIKETDEGNNGNFASRGIVAKIIVSPAIAPGYKKKLEDNRYKQKERTIDPKPTTKER